MRAICKETGQAALHMQIVPCHVHHFVKQACLPLEASEMLMCRACPGED